MHPPVGTICALSLLINGHNSHPSPFRKGLTDIRLERERSNTEPPWWKTQILTTSVNQSLASPLTEFAPKP